MQSFLDEEGQAEFVCLTDRSGATLRITFKGAQATRPAEEIAVDDFVGIKSHRAKGKRISNYDIDTLQFIEPELPDEPEEEEPETLDGGETEGVEFAAAEERQEPAGDGPDAAVDPEQLDLF